MPLHIVHSNRVERLMESLAGTISDVPPAAGFLTGETVLIDNPMLGSWVNLQLALKNSIAANVHYKAPAVFLWELAQALFDDLPKRYALDEEELTWRVMRALEPEELRVDVFKPIFDYLEGDKKVVDIKRYQLATAMADLFDQYLVFRPDWFSAAGRDAKWDAGQQVSIKDMSKKWSDTEEWQRALWQKIKVQHDETAWHRAKVQSRLDLELEKDSESQRVKLTLEKLGIHRLFVFGITSMPKAQFETLMRLGPHLDIHMYLLNPCREFWFDIEQERTIARLQREQGEPRTRQSSSEYLDIGNPLLASQAQQVQDFIELLYDHGDNADEIELDENEQFEEVFNADGKAGQNTLLRSIQQDILDLQFRGTVVSLDNRGDEPHKLPAFELRQENIQSIHIHNCHGPMREVEVLHDQLLDMFKHIKGLQPRDIVVMMPRVQDYAPYIEAVFGGAPSGQHISYHIADRTLAEESPILNSFQILLGLGESRMPLSEMLSVLEVPAVHRNFGMERDDYDLARQWLIESGVRWGADAEHRASLELPGYADFSWEFGFNRLLAGYALGASGGHDDIVNVGNGAQDYQVAPFEGPLDARSDLLNSLTKFHDEISWLRGKLRDDNGKPKRSELKDWSELLLDALNRFYAPVAEDNVPFTLLRKQVQALAQSADFFDGEVPAAVIREAVDAMLSSTTGGRHPWSEGVKFCSLLPMRGVPFRVVYLLGMNLEDYPRQRPRRSFDLMQEDWRKGDRSARTDDRWLFLEALLSARDAFHVSYIGRSIHKNEELQPSVLVSELIDYVREGYYLGEDSANDPWPKELNIFKGPDLAEQSSFLHTVHPLQPYSTKYFTPTPGWPRMRSFKRDAFDVITAGGRQTVDQGEPTKDAANADGEEVVVLSVEEFISCFTKPWDAYFKNRGVFFDRAVSVEDEEIFEIEPGLEDWKTRNLLATRLRQCYANEPPESDADALEEAVEWLEDVQVAKGSWPIGAGADLLKNELCESGIDFYFACAGQPPESHEVDLYWPRGNGSSERAINIRGRIDLPSRDVIVHSPSSPKADKLLDFYLRYLLLMLSGDWPQQPEVFRGVFWNKDKGIATEGKDLPKDMDLPMGLDRTRISAESNESLFSFLCQTLIQYRERGLPFAPAISLMRHAYPDDESYLLELKKLWDGSFNSWGLKQNYGAYVYFKSSQFMIEDPFKKVSNDIWAAVRSWLEPTDAGGAN